MPQRRQRGPRHAPDQVLCVGVRHRYSRRQGARHLRGREDPLRRPLARWCSPAKWPRRMRVASSPKSATTTTPENAASPTAATPRPIRPRQDAKRANNSAVSVPPAPSRRVACLTEPQQVATGPARRAYRARRAASPWAASVDHRQPDTPAAACRVPTRRLARPVRNARIDTGQLKQALYVRRALA